VSHPLPRYTDQHLEDERKIVRIILEAQPADQPVATVSRATLPGDTRRLRGIPVIARGVSGTSPSTDPYAETKRRRIRHGLDSQDARR